MRASQRLQALPLVVWQLLQMGLLGITGVAFIPSLARMVDPSLLAGVLQAQVFVYYLVLLTQFGFAWSGPADLAQTGGNSKALRLWRVSVRAKLLLLCGPVAMVCVLVYARWADSMPYVWVFATLLVAYALNSNWFVQALGNFTSGVMWVVLGLLLSSVLLAVLWYGMMQEGWPQRDELVGAVVVAILVLPQSCLGMGSWWLVRRMCAEQTGHWAVECSQAVSWKDASATLCKDAPFVMGQLLLQASTTLGTFAVGILADAQTAAAYAATEKLFNLGATVLVGVYTALYPTFARLYHDDRRAYWVQTQSLLGRVYVGGMLLFGLLAWVGEPLLVLYLSAPLAERVVSVLLPFGCWLVLCLGQHIAAGYLVLAGRQSHVLWFNGVVLGLTVACGGVLAQYEPINWVYGMIAGQLLATGWLLRCYVIEKEH